MRHMTKMGHRSIPHEIEALKKNIYNFIIFLFPSSTRSLRLHFQASVLGSGYWSVLVLNIGVPRVLQRREFTENFPKGGSANRYKAEILQWGPGAKPRLESGNEVSQKLKQKFEISEQFC